MLGRKMEKFKFLKHTADIKFQAYGKSLKEAFSNAALALTAVFSEDEIKGKTKKKISVLGNDDKELLYSFLEEIIILVDTKNLLLGKVSKVKIVAGKLEAELLMDRTENYDIRGDVKAVTYNEMLIEKKAGKFMVQVVVDV
ncbi:protein archease [Candidatus Woesearchaeota archaeon CG10_big_fil_rev_8_21_14_0_10_34_12]|nr:MAG: protein archease [Candidatus Woesearchaeota archaeon CG10_big_fil_rev_8_21_14_0_10_34_12]